MKLKGSIEEIQKEIFEHKSHKRKLSFSQKVKELEDTLSFIDENKWALSHKTDIK